MYKRQGCVWNCGDEVEGNNQGDISSEEAAAKWLEHQNTWSGKLENLRNNGLRGTSAIVAMLVVFAVAVGFCAWVNNSTSDSDRDEVQVGARSYSATTVRDEVQVGARSYSATTARTVQNTQSDSARNRVRVRLNNQLREAEAEVSAAQQKFNRADGEIKAAFENLKSTQRNTVQRTNALRDLKDAESQQDIASEELRKARNLVCDIYIDIAGSSAFNLQERRDAIRQGTRSCTEPSQHDRLKIG